MKYTISMAFLTVTFCYSLLLNILFYGKSHIKTKETELFGKIAFTNLIGIIIEIFCIVTLSLFGPTSFISIVINKMFLAYFLVILMFFSLYVVYVAEIQDLQMSKDKMRFLNIIKIIIKVLFILSLISIIFLQTKLYIKGDVTYSYGASVRVVYIMSALCSLGCIIYLIYNYKSIKKKRNIPIIAFIILMGLTSVIQQLFPQLTLATSAESLIIFLMYFTIENPDIKMIEQLEMAKDYADKANRAKTDFLSSMSHEIRTPLNAISGFSECIMNANTLEEAKENAKDIIDASGTLIEIVNGILDVSKIEAGKMDIVSSPYNSHDVFSEPAKLIEPRMREKGLDFSCYVAPDIPKTLYGDHANIKKIITNLLSNACKYTSNGFVKYEVNCVNTNDFTKLIISVEDSGRGIKKQNIEKMFNKFQRLEEDRNTTIEGTGLGLAITKQLTELMGGKVIVHSVYGKGSKFTVIINQKLSDKEVKEEHEYKTTLNLENVKILLVDDTLLNLKVAKKILEGYNANLITTCESGFECLDIIKKGEKFDIILLDDMMPKMSGVTTLKKLKEIPGFNTPTVALTANAITGMKESYLAEGFTDYLAKPIEKDELVRVINQILGRVVTEKIPIITEDMSKDNKEENDQNVDEKNRNDIIPVEDNIEEILGDKLDLSDEVDTHFDNALAHVDHINENVEVLDDIKEIETIPVVDIDLPTETIEKVDANYLKNNGVDIDHALELLGDMEMYNSTVSDFVTEVDDKWNRIVEYKNNSDMENYAIEVHSLKSDSKYLGLMKLADIAYQHELKSKESDINYVNEHFNELEDEFNSAMSIIKKYENSIKKD